MLCKLGNAAYFNMHNNRPLVFTLFQEDGKIIAESILRTIVKLIYDYHSSGQQQSIDATTLYNNGHNSVKHVASAVEKVFHMVNPQSKAMKAVKYFHWYLEELKLHNNNESLAVRLNDVRNAVAHSCMTLTPDASTVNVYAFFEEKKRKKWKSIAEYSQEQFDNMCALMRRVFLSWERLTSYLPEYAIMPQASEVEARKELPAAVLIR